MGDSDAENILNLCCGNGQFYRYCEAKPTIEQVLNDLHITPPNISMSDKYYVGFYEDKALVAVMDLISRMFMKYMNTSLVQSIFTGLRPAVVGLLAAATLLLCNKENFSTPMENPWQFWISVALFLATAFGTGYLKINPIRMICYAGFAGLLLLY